MGGHKSIRCSSYPVPAAPIPPPVADYHVTGTLTPNAVGDYFYAGLLNTLPYYRRADGLYFIWAMTPEGDWLINNEVNNFLPPCFRRFGGNLVGVYTPILGAIGTATVITGPT